MPTLVMVKRPQAEARFIVPDGPDQERHIVAIAEAFADQDDVEWSAVPVAELAHSHSGDVQ